MAAVDIDVPLLSSYCSLPKDSVVSLLDAPTSDLVRRLLENVALKAREHNALTSSNLRLGVEIENAVRGGESKSRVLKNSVDKGIKEVAQLKNKVQAEEAARSSVETELKDLRAATSESCSEISAQKQRITVLESSNRDTLSLLEAKTAACDKLSEELSIQHQKTVESRRNISNLEQSIQAADTVSTNARFHEQSLQQEIGSLKRNNEWLDKELKAKSAEHTNQRKEKNLRIAELQRQTDEAQSRIDAASRTETNLRRRLEELNQKAEDAFAQIQKMQEETARRDESFRVELDAANRLTELTKNSANTERQRQQDLLAQLEAAKEDASEQLGKISAELETEHQDRENAESRVAELEVRVEDLEASLAVSHRRQPSENSDHQGINGFVTPTRNAAAPLGSPGTPRLKGGLSMTQMYSNYNEMKSDLEFERRRNEKLSSTLDEMIQDLETRQPEVEELREDHERLQFEIAEMSSLVDAIGKERDQALKGMKKWEGQIEAKAKEGDVLRQQLRDLSSQIKVLLVEVHLRDQGHKDLSIEARTQLERLALGQSEDEVQAGVTDTDRFISENLVSFRNMTEMQEQNTKLLKITRELGDKMEHEENVRKQLEGTRDWEDLQQKYERCKDEVKSLITQSQSYIRERDMFGRMLSHRGQVPAEADANSTFGESANGNATIAEPLGGSVLNSIEESPSAKDLSDYPKLFKEMSAHFDAYRNEAATDRSTLKGQVDELSKANGELRIDAARGNSQATFANERYEMLKANYKLLGKENEELQKRSQSLSDNASKQEMRIQHAVENLVEAKGLADSMRNETANLKAEKDFWKTIEKRIMEENENLLGERDRLNAMITNVQNLLNEREFSDNEARRRLQTQVDILDKELQATKTKLTEESEETKRLAQRREYDNEQSQKRISDLVSSLSSIREQLIAASTTKDHLTVRVEELNLELRNAEERVNILHSSSRPKPGGALEGLSQQSVVDEEESALSKEQELAYQNSELRRDLDLKGNELENVKGQVEQYKAISLASEEELHSLTETHDLYRQETDKLIEDKSSKIKDLEQRIEETSSELASVNSELSDLQKEEAEHNRRSDDQKRTFEGQLSELKDQDDRHAAAAQYYQEDLKVQAEIAQQAQHSYENELVKHADAAKALQKARGEYNELKLDFVEVKTEAESARTKLRQNEVSWAEAKDRYKRELADLKSGQENLKTQNDRLHQQVESVMAQMSTFSKREPISAQSPDGESSFSSLENLQEVINYLRREKEIVDVQLELSSQEGKRLKQQLDYTQTQLDDTRLRLNQQRRIETDSERSNLEHRKLMETIDELNTFRESSVTLRAESRQAQSTLSTKITEFEELKARIEPLQAEISALKNERETQEGEMKLLKENSDRWQQRAQNVLQKYDRIDPAELESLKGQLKTLESERDELQTAKQNLQEQAEGASNQIAQIHEQSNEKIATMRARLTDQFKSRSKTLSDTIREKDAALQASTTEKAELDGRLAELSGLQAELEKAKAERDAALESVGTQATVVNVNAADGSEDGQVDEDENAKPLLRDLESLQEKLAAAESRINAEASRSSDLQNQLDVSQSKINELEAQTANLQESIDTLKYNLAQVQAAAQQQANNTANSGLEQHVAQLREDLAIAQQDAENLRTAASVSGATTTVSAEEGSKSIADQITERVETIRIELEKRHQERVRQTEETLEKRTNAMKTNLTKKLTEGKSQLRQSLTAEHEKILQTLKADHLREFEQLENRHKDELDELNRKKDFKFAELKEKLESEKSEGAKSEGQTSVKAEDTSHGLWQPTEAEARDFLQTNEIARNIVRKYMLNQVAKAKDELSTQLKTEYDKSLAESQTKANTAKEHAVMMEGKKTSLQVNMANNKARIAQFKIGIVEKAAQETPDKAIKEVWSAVKDAKPPPATAPAQQEATKVQQGPVTTTSTNSNPNAQAVGTIQQKPAQPSLQDQIGPVPTFGRPSPAVTTVKTAGPQSPVRQQPVSRAASSSSPNAADKAQQSPRNLGQISSQQNPSQPAANPQASTGTAPNASRGAQQSGLPVARGGSIRGNPNQRARGAGTGRGGPQGPVARSNANQGPPQGRGSPTSSGINAGAKQFVPGNKRPRDEEQQRGDLGAGKRIRGGGVGTDRGA